MSRAVKQPNILLITSDQQHFSTLGAINDRISTPSLDMLCRQGTRFDRAYCPNPTCTPTRASVITGMYPSQHGAWTLGTKLFEDVPVVGDLFSKAGYFTCLVGKAHFQPLASRPGMESLECQPILRDLDFWRKFHGPWYGFEHVETARMHADESHAGQHYAIWMEEKGLKNWKDFFQPWPSDPKKIDKRRHYFESVKRIWSLPEEFHYSVWTAERTIAQIDRAAAEGRPFFCWSSFHDPHPPYTVPQPWASMYDPANMVPGSLMSDEHDGNPVHFGMTQRESPDFRSLWPDDGAIHGAHSHLHTVEELQKDMAVYYGMVSLMDKQIGRILQRLEQAGQADNTLVVFTTDHGHFLGQHGLIAKAIHHYEDLLRIPFIVRWPGSVPAGAVSRTIQNLVDLAPTFLSAAAIDIPGCMTGVDQRTAWCQDKPVRNWSITENHHGTHVCNMRTYVDERYKITVYARWDDGELFDLQEDPGEVCNLWKNPQAQELKKRLLLKFMQATMACEPIPMPRIAGA
ncbi:MAG: sulfatase-like hydrolase/transferase [Planctomycetes bacterium]|nr:sulfatase-like hydrolase/transferase [Planctomycetota bacterium]